MAQLIDLDINTVHSYQGNETQIVLVVQQSVSNWGLCGDSTYLLSALTRSTQHTVLLTIGNPNPDNIENLTQLVY